MAGGSVTPESDTDQRCNHCTLWFASKGISKHEKNCPIRKLPVEVVPKHDDSSSSQRHAPEVDTNAEPHEGVEEGDIDEVDSNTTDMTQERNDEQQDQTGLGLTGPPEQPADAAAATDAGVDQEPETLDCPHCGKDTGDPSEFFQEGHRYRCQHCKGTWRGSP